MEHKTTRDLDLINLVTDFENKFEQGTIDYVDEKTIYQLIEYYEKENLLDKAMEVVEVALDQFKYRTDFYIVKARLFYNDKKINECINTLDVAASFSPFEKDLLSLKVKALCQKKNFEEARLVLEELSVYHPENKLDFYIAESFIFEGLKDFKAMYQSLKSALKIDNQNSEGLERFWEAVDLSREYQNSIEFHKALIDEQPYNHLAWYNLGLSYSYNWEYSKAIESLEYSFIINPQFEQGYLECAELCIQEGRISKALDIYKDANNRFGPESDLMISIASCYLKLGNIAEARMILLRALRFDNHNDEIYFLLGESYTQSNSWFSAINAYHKAIEIDDQREEYTLALAKAYSEVEAYNKATIYFYKSTQLCQEESTYWAEYVYFVLKLGLFKEALQILDEADEYTFGADLLYCRAITLFFLKKKKAGLDILTEALEEDFTMHSIIFKLAPELEVDKDINSMIKYYEKEYGEYL
jgi:tetratricopeptide (TPR) repeat protein